jgi:ribosomal protein S18 acetylase RimI-like enzyme
MEIRNPEEAEIPAILSMMLDFARFEGLEEFFEATETRLRSALFGPDAFVESLVAKVDGEYAGYAIFYPNFSTFRGQKGYYLEDLYVDPAFRGKRIGEALIRTIAARGAARGFERIDFQVLEWNTAAILFYEKLGGRPDDTERHFKLTDEAFRLLAHP